ncbi:MAG TPA: ABC transporter permease [Chthoniobacterales bacterium]
MAINCWNALDIFSQLFRRDLQSRHRGAVLGFGAMLVNQLVMLALYVLVFGFVFRGRYGIIPDESGLDYALGLFVALTFFNYTAECLTRAPGLILERPNYVKKVVFPLELIPLSANCATLAQLLLSTVPLLLVFASATRHLSWAILWLVALLVPLFLFNLGILWLGSALGVFVRDFQLLIGPVNQVLMFGSAVFYSLKNLPAPFGAILQWNPFARLFQMAREAVLAGRTPDLMVLTVICVASLLFCWGAYTSFHHLKAAFADVL